MATHTRRIGPAGSTQDAIVSMCDGNPGALNVMLMLLTHAEEAGMAGYESGVSYLMDLDEAGIYGPDIWVAFKDVCGEDIAALAMALREGRGELARRVAAVDAVFR